MSWSTWSRLSSGPGDRPVSAYRPEGLEPGFLVAFTTRLGGVSPSPFDSLNLALHTGDEPANVRRNRAIVAATLGYNKDRLTCARQVHGDSVKIVEAADVGAGSDDDSTAIADTDALVTFLPDVPLAIHTADCVPIAIVSPAPKVVAVVHAGWRGTLAGIANRAVGLMAETFGCHPDRLAVYIGPAIRRCCYTVNDDIRAQFTDAFGESITGPGPGLDLAAINVDQLRQAGVRPEAIADIDICTACDSRFFSYRRDGKTGRQAAIVAIIGA